MDSHCQAITHKGKVCGGDASSTGLCKVHNHAMKLDGPNTFAVKQLENTHKMRLAEFETKALTTPYTAKEYEAEIKIINGLFERKKKDLLLLQKNQVAWSGGVDPDAEAKAAKQVRRAKFDAIKAEHARKREERRRLEDAAWQQRLYERRIQEEGGYMYGGGLGVANNRDYWADEPRERQLRDIVADPQSVHTTEAVKQTKDIIEKIRNVDVPEEYRWSKETCSKTPGEIITECKLSMPAAMQMMTQYSYDTAIYDIEEGIYGKVLDSVWQFVKSHADKADLCKILKQEMEDNIGMCAQGNLTRICNIVSGYMEGVAPSESLSERLGRLMPPLMEIEDLEKRKQEATRILVENRVGVAEWAAWMDAIMA